MSKKLNELHRKASRIIREINEALNEGTQTHFMKFSFPASQRAKLTSLAKSRGPVTITKNKDDDKDEFEFIMTGTRRQIQGVRPFVGKDGGFKKLKTKLKV